MSGPRGVGLAACVLALAVCAQATAHEPAARAIPLRDGTATDFATELAQIDAQLAQAESSGSPTEQVFWRYTRATLTRDPEDWSGVWHLIEESIEDGVSSPELLLYRATVALELHRPDAAESALDQLATVDPLLAGGTYPKLLRGDVAQQRHLPGEALRLYEEVLAVERSWQALARVAFCQRQAGRYRQADRLYTEAQEPLTAKEMRRWAWLEVQRGLVARDRGRADDAAEHFRRADLAYPGSPHKP